MFVALFGKKIYLTLKLTFDLELCQNKNRNQKRPLLKILHLVQVSFVPSGIILLQNAVGMSLTCPLYDVGIGLAAADLRYSMVTEGVTLCLLMCDSCHHFCVMVVNCCPKRTSALSLLSFED